MKVNGDTAIYLAQVIANLANIPGEVAQQQFGRVCPECELEVDPLDADHIVTDYEGDMLVLVGCEGFWCINPNLVGMSVPNWTYPA